MRTVSDSHPCTIRNGIRIGKIDSQKKDELRTHRTPPEVGVLVRSTRLLT